MNLNRLIDCYLQGWNSDINSKDRYAFFSSFKQTHGLSQYLLTVKNVALKRNLVRLRLGVSFLKPHRLRFSKTTNRRTLTALFAKIHMNQKYTFCWYARNIQC